MNKAYLLVICLFLTSFSGCVDDKTEENLNITEVEDNTIGDLVKGCLDESSSNYNPEAEIDDGSCIYVCELVPHSHCSGANFSGQDLSGLNLTGIDFSNADLTLTNLSYTDLSYANLSDSKLYNVSSWGKGANFRFTNLTNADLTNVDLTFADLAYADLTGVDLTTSGSLLNSGTELYKIHATSLRGCPIQLPNGWQCLNNNLVGQYADLTGANFSNTDLTNIDLNWTLLNGANFTGANLANGSFKYANLTGTIFYGANLSGANLDSVLVGTNFRFADLSYTAIIKTFMFDAFDAKSSADFSFANLTGARFWMLDEVNFDFTGAILRNSSLHSLNLSGADFSHTDLTGVEFSNVNLNYANLTGTIFSGADLGSTSLVGANLRFADMNHVTFDYYGDLSGADLSGANLSHAFLRGVILNNADIVGADLTGAYIHAYGIEGTNLTDAMLKYSSISFYDHYSDFPRPILSSGYICHASGPSWAGNVFGPDMDYSYQSFLWDDLSGINLSYVNFSNSNFYDVDFRGSDLTGTNLSYADFSGGNFANAIITDATFFGASWSQTIWIDGLSYDEDYTLQVLFR